jgi:hypothetical protein
VDLVVGEAWAREKDDHVIRERIVAALQVVVRTTKVSRLMKGMTCLRIGCCSIGYYFLHPQMQVLQR